MQNRRRSLMVWLGLAFLMYNLFKDQVVQNNKDAYLEKLNLHLTGIVSEGPYDTQSFNNCYVIRVRVLQSNVQNYDPRGKESAYYCIIQGHLAEFYQFSAQEVHIGDTVSIDTKNKEFCYFVNGQKISLSIFLNDEPEFMSYVEKNFQKF